MGKGLSLEFSRRDRERVVDLLRGGVQSVRTVLRALALRKMDEVQTTPAVDASRGLSAKRYGRSTSYIGRAPGPCAVREPASGPRSGTG